MNTINDNSSVAADVKPVGPTALHIEAKFPVVPALVYELLTNGTKFGEVTGQPGKGGETEGVPFSLFDGWLTGRQVELIPNEMIAQAWRFQNWESGIYSMIRFKLLPEGNGTRLILDQDGIPAVFHEHVKTNWDGFYFAPFRKHFQQLLRDSQPK